MFHCAFEDSAQSACPNPVFELILYIRLIAATGLTDAVYQLADFDTHFRRTNKMMQLKQFEGITKHHPVKFVTDPIISHAISTRLVFVLNCKLRL